MTAQSFQIAIVEPSQIVFQGLRSLLSDTGRNFSIIHASDFKELQQLFACKSLDIVIVNPTFLQIDGKTFQTLRNEYATCKWIGILYSFFDQQLLSQFDGFISINDPTHSIISGIQQVIQAHKHPDHEAAQETLSDREMEVLQLVVTGLANKEIADRLNISTYTVITHRKNISLKTGIKSVSGLTLYAVVKGLISVDRFIN